MVLKNHGGADDTIRAARTSEIGSYARHEVGMVNFLKLYEEIGLINRNTISSAAYRKLTSYYNAHS